jgi:hypothetical protein
MRDGKDWLALNRRNFVDRYKNSELKIILEIIWGAGAERNKYHFLFRGVPFVLQGHFKEPCSAD